MASRRLDISSLLCDDPQPPFSPLDVLVHAATEERRRLEQSPPRPTPRAPSPPRPYDLPPAFHQHRSPQLLHYDRRLVPDPDLAQHQRAQALEFHRQQQERERALRAQELDRRRREDDERRLFDQYGRQQREQQEYELRKREERLREERLREEQFREIERRKLDEQEQHQRLLKQRELERRELERRELERRELERDLERRELERRDHERREHERRELERQLAERQQRDAVDRELDLARRREQERIDELRRRQQIQLDHQPRYLEPHTVVTSPHPPSISHLISHSASPRPSDRPQITSLPIKIPPDSPTIAIPTSSQEDPRPIKKRRYSESPTRPIPDDKEHIARERDKMVVGELGYGRIESLVAAPAHPPRRPGSGHGHNRKVAVADLLTVDKDRPISSTSEIRDRDAHRLLSPLGRRSPPGSQIGRAKAARKSDEHLLREPPPQPVEPELKKPKEEPTIKQEFRPSRSQDTLRSPVIDDARPTKPISKEVAPPLATTTAPAPPKVQPPARKRNQEDVYEWFLQQYEEEPSPTVSVRVEPPHTPSPSLSPVTSAPAAPSAAKSPTVPHRSPFSAAVSLDEELEELVSKPPMSNSSVPATIRKQDPDIDMELDVDLAVNELVETLEADADDVKREPKAMEVDVEAELLSLLDDAPKPAPSSSSSSAARRNPPSSAAPTSSSSHAAASVHSHSHSHSHAVHAKQQNHNRSPSEAPHVSPVISNAVAAVLSPVLAVRHPSTRPTSERGSMPPPASTGGVGKKGMERAESVTPTSTGAATTATGSNPTAKKKKETTAKAKAKNANGAVAPATTPAPGAAKAKAKPTAKGKKGVAADAATAPGTTLTPPGPSGGKGAKGPAGALATGRKNGPSASRSRSASVMPAGNASVGPESEAVRAEKQEEEEDSDAEANEDDKLYCVCKTKYDEDRFMIACDRCDEWYHTQCVKMPDLEVDLVDQFICPLCIEKNPHLNLRTTYKARCLFGLRHPDPSSTKACHKAARGAFSKYCSDECGVKYMQSRIDTWAKKGGKAEKLWDSVKGAEKREGIVCAVEMESDEEEDADTTAAPADADVNGCAKIEADGAKGEGDEQAEDEKDANSSKEQKQQQPQPPPKLKHKHQHIKTRVVQPTMSKVARETKRLNSLLDTVIRLREEIKRGMEIVVWREQLLKLASERAEAVGQCGWDQRLCMDDEEWADIGAGVLESYEDAVLRAEAAKEEDGAEGEMEVDGAEEQWWCPGKKVCDRHQGWQTVRYKDVCKEKEKKEEALAKLTTREREIRKRIEDMLDPQNTNNPATANHTTIQISGAKDTSHVLLKSSNTKSVNGHAKSKAAASSGDAHKKGKKRKAPAS